MTAVGDSGAEVPVNEESLTGTTGNIDMDGAALVTRETAVEKINLNAGDITLIRGLALGVVPATDTSGPHIPDQACENQGEKDETQIYLLDLDMHGNFYPYLPRG